MPQNQYIIQRHSKIKQRNNELSYIMELLQKNIDGLEGAKICDDGPPFSQGKRLPQYAICIDQDGNRVRIADINRGFQMADSVTITPLPEFAASISQKVGATMKEQEPPTLGKRWQTAFTKAVNVFKGSRPNEARIEGSLTRTTQAEEAQSLLGTGDAARVYHV